MLGIWEGGLNAVSLPGPSGCYLTMGTRHFSEQDSAGWRAVFQTDLRELLRKAMSRPNAQGMHGGRGARKPAECPLPNGQAGSGLVKQARKSPPGRTSLSTWC